jgi:hypothetical protein
MSIGAPRKAILPAANELSERMSTAPQEPLPIFTHLIVDLLTRHRFPAKSIGEALVEARSLYFDLAPLLKEKLERAHSGRQPLANDSKRAKLWLRRVQRLCRRLLEGKHLADQLCKEIAEACDDDLLLLFERLIYACGNHPAERTCKPGRCSACKRTLKAQKELDFPAINNIRSALGRHWHDASKWRPLVRQIEIRAATLASRPAKRGRKPDPLLKQLVNRLSDIYSHHHGGRRGVGKDIKGKYCGPGFEFVCAAVTFYGYSHSELRRSTIGTYFELRHSQKDVSI